MLTLLIAAGSAVAFVVAYLTYGRWLGRKVFELSAAAVVPAHALRDGRDYVPTTKSVVFGHHFTSIAGTGPIVGPAIAVIWGWLPALLWVVLGSIFIGAVHDFGALVVSLRHRGRTVGEVAGDLLNRRVRVLFLAVLFLALTIVLAIFGLVIAAVFKQYPQAITPCLVQVPLAVAIGLWLHRRGADLKLPSLVALGLMYLAVVFADWGPLHAINTTLAGLPTVAWVGVLLAYSYAASVLPVWTLLQPRDFINSLQLLSALALVVVGLAVAALVGGAPPADGAARPSLEIVAPMIRTEGLAELPLLFPFLFITVACGAVSGFHCLVSSGTSSKQLEREPDARFVGYGAMLTEGFLAVVVILACVAGLGLAASSTGGTTGQALWAERYASWSAANGLAAKVGAFVDGSAAFLKALGIPAGWAVTLMGVFVASFAATTLDTATRLQRYVVQELAHTFIHTTQKPTFNERGRTTTRRFATPLLLRLLASRHGATLVAVVTAAALAALPKPGLPWSWQTAGTGGLILWPMFGATNQLLAGLAFLVLAFWLRRRGKPVWFVVPPLLFMLAMPAWALLHQALVRGVGMDTSWLAADPPNLPLLAIAAATLALEAWLVVEALRLWPKTRPGPAPASPEPSPG